jgi:hypothetical protein
MSKAALLQQKVATLPEPIAAEVLDFLEFVTAKRQLESTQKPINIHQLRGSLKGRLSSSDEFAAQKSYEIRLEE